MPWLTLDPNLQVRPDFVSAAYDALCTTVAIAEGVEKDIIVTCLSNAWDIKNNTKKATWEEQVRQDKVEAVEAMLTWECELQLELEECRMEDKAEKKEKEKKKLKLKDFVANKPVKVTAQLFPSHYAIHKLDEQEYIELYYFTLEGCTEAWKIDCTIGQDIFIFTKAEDTLLLKSMALHKPSNKVIPDEDLNWCQMSIAMTTLLHHISQTSWPEHYVVALWLPLLNSTSTLKATPHTYRWTGTDPALPHTDFPKKEIEHTWSLLA